MNVSLTAELDKYVLDKVKTGRYSSASEVVREALRLLQEQDMAKNSWTQEVQRAIELGLDDLANGRYVEGTAEELIDDVKRRGRERLARETRKSA